MGQIQTLEELLDLIRRRRWLIILVICLGIALAAVYAKARPDTFEAIAVIQIQSSMLAGGEGTPGSSAAMLLQSIEQRLTTRENLLAVIDRHGLFTDLPGLTTDQKVNLLRSSVRFESVASATSQGYGAARAISAILIFARLDTADLAARVANDFAQSVLDQSSAGQLDRATETAAFFKAEEARLWAEISALEAEMAGYKNANGAALPSQRDALREERVALETGLREVDQEQAALEGQRRTIDTGGTLRATDQRTLQTLDAQAGVLAAQRDALTARRDEIDAVLAQTPEVDRVMSGFERALAQLQEQYEVINRRLAEADTALRLAEQRQDERFTLLERAATPQFPIGGGGKKIVAAGAVGSLLLALGIAFFLDLLRPVVRTAAQMERQLALRPVISIPEVPAAARSTQRRRSLLQLVDDPQKPILGLPRYAVVAGGATVCLMLAAAAIG